MYKDKDDRDIPRIVPSRRHGYMDESRWVVLIKSADPGKLLIIRQDKGADHRYLLELGISRRRLITKLRSRAPWPGLCRALAAIRVRNYAMGSFGSVKNQLHEVQAFSSAPKMNSCGNHSTIVNRMYFYFVY